MKASVALERGDLDLRPDLRPDLRIDDSHAVEHPANQKTRYVAFRDATGTWVSKTRCRNSIEGRRGLDGASSPFRWGVAVEGARLALGRSPSPIVERLAYALFANHLLGRNYLRLHCGPRRNPLKRPSPTRQTGGQISRLRGAAVVGVVVLLQIAGSRPTKRRRRSFLERLRHEVLIVLQLGCDRLWHDHLGHDRRTLSTAVT